MPGKYRVNPAPRSPARSLRHGQYRVLAGIVVVEKWPGRGRLSRHMKANTFPWREAKDEFDLPFEILEAGSNGAGRRSFNSTHHRGGQPVLIRRAFLATHAARTIRHAAPVPEDSFVDELVAGRGRPRATPLMGGAHFPRCYVDVKPRALRARPAHVRRTAALLRQYPFDAGGRAGSARVGPRGRRSPQEKSTVNAYRVEDAIRRIRGPFYKPYHRGAAAPVSARPATVISEAAVLDRLAIPCPSDRRGAKDEGGPARRRHPCWGDRYGHPGCVPRRRGSRRGPCWRGPAATWSAANKALCGRLHHGALRQSGRRPCTPIQLELNRRALYGRAPL